MKVLKIELEAPVCSFRYPHFLVGEQITFDMPPPSTIFGHVASALGTWPERDSFRFAYSFSSTSKCVDFEKQHITGLSSSKKFKIDGKEHPACVDIKIQPGKREFLFGARLTLYIDNLDFEEAFVAPVFPVVLGRSQDLACYTDVTTVELERRERCYFEHTLLPFTYRKRTPRGVSVLMPKYIGPAPLREPTFEKYIVLKERIYYGEQADDDRGTLQMIDIQGEPLDVFVDPYTVASDGYGRALAFHSFVNPGV